MGAVAATQSSAGVPEAEPDAVIHTEDLSKVYPGADFAAVDKLNLDVRAGEIFGLLGPNGAGKRTASITDCLAGLLTTTEVRPPLLYAFHRTPASLAKRRALSSGNGSERIRP